MSGSGPSGGGGSGGGAGGGSGAREVESREARGLPRKLKPTDLDIGINETFDKDEALETLLGRIEEKWSDRTPSFHRLEGEHIFYTNKHREKME